MLSENLGHPFGLATHTAQIETLEALSEGDDPELLKKFAKQKVLSHIMDSLAKHNGNPTLLLTAKPLIGKLCNNKEEIDSMKDQLKVHMGRVQKHIDNFDKPTADIVKEGETSNTLCSIFMGVPDLAKQGIEKNIIKELKDLWDKKNPISFTLKKVASGEKPITIPGQKPLTLK